MFGEAEFSGVKLLLDETLLRMMEMMKNTYENRARILKLERRKRTTHIIPRFQNSVILCLYKRQLLGG